MKPEDAALTLLALAEVPQVMSAFMPSLFTMATFSDDPEKVRYLRRGEVVGGAVSLGIAVAIGILARSVWPIAGAVAVLGIILYEYERAIRNPVNGGQDMRAF